MSTTAAATATNKSFDHLRGAGTWVIIAAAQGRGGSLRRWRKLEVCDYFYSQLVSMHDFTPDDPMNKTDAFSQISYHCV